jgi:voltage-dependent potassium channel beta subunit
VSVLSFGSWVTFGPQLEGQSAVDCIAAAAEAGVNFFDNAEAYAGGKSEEIMGAAFAELKWPRHDFVVSTKLFWGIHRGVNMQNTLNRKYLSQAIDGSLERFGLDFVDLVFCHRADPETPLEETVWAMSDMVSAGKALYWGTSEWTADEIRAAWEIAERHHLHKPVMEQPQYNLLNRRRVEREYSRLYEDIGLGLTIWSPLASGLLTGKYIDGVPADSRAALPGYEWLRDMLTDPSSNTKVKALKAVADGLGCSLAQLSLAWCTKNPHVSTVITGASRVEQVRENMTALEVAERLDAEVLARIDELTRK